MVFATFTRMRDGDAQPVEGPGNTLTVNLAHVEAIRPHGTGSRLMMLSGAQLYVTAAPAEIAAAADPENACPDPPGACGYYTHYLAYGPPDLTHAGYHAAVTIQERHAATCRAWERGRDCSICTAAERRLRA